MWWRGEEGGVGREEWGGRSGEGGEGRGYIQGCGVEGGRSGERGEGRGCIEGVRGEGWRGEEVGEWRRKQHGVGMRGEEGQNMRHNNNKLYLRDQYQHMDNVELCTALV